MQKILAVAAVAFAAAGSGAAQATTTALAFAGNNANLFDSFSSPTSFLDDWTFTVPAGDVGSLVATDAISNFVSGSWNAAITDLEIFNVTGPKTLISGSPFTAGSPPWFASNSAAGLLPGSYEIEVTGHTMASNGGGYGGNVTLNLLAVPEPETYAMLLAGLGLFGFVARRRFS